MGRGFSLYLDGLRLVGAFMVLLVHWQNPLLTGADHAWMVNHDIGGDGVVIFFVLSGLLIAYTGDNRRAEGVECFAADRLSRLWSVALPALLFCAILDNLGHFIAPSFYEMVPFDGEIAWPALLSSMTFTNEVWFLSAQVGSNSPYWSLGYEAWYYAIFAGFFFSKKTWRWWIAGALAFIAGPKVMLLAPSWLFGVWCWRMIASGRLNKISRMTAWMLTIVPVVFYFMMHRALFFHQLSEQTSALLGNEAMAMLGYSDTFAWAMVLGSLVALHILGVSALLQGRGARTSPYPFESAIRWLAGGTFALYLVHYPILYFIGAFLPGDVDMPWRQASLLMITIAIAYLFAELTERRHHSLRNYLRRVAQSVVRRPGSVTAAE